MNKIKLYTNNSINFLYQNKGKIIAGVAGLLALAGGFNWKYQDIAKKAQKEMPKVVEKINEETANRTNEFGELKPLK